MPPNFQRLWAALCNYNGINQRAMMASTTDQMECGKVFNTFSEQQQSRDNPDVGENLIPESRHCR